MYRQYEDPRALEKLLVRLREKAEALNDMLSHHNSPELYEQLECLNDKIEEMEQRVNFAWQDEEFG